MRPTEKHQPQKGPLLADDAKKALARTGWEADAMNDYWIDTEHLLLGILGEENAWRHNILLKQV